MQSGRRTIHSYALRSFLSVSLRPELLISALRSFLYHSLRAALLTATATALPADAAGRADIVPFTIEREPSSGSAVDSSPPVALRFEAFGRGFRLRLEPNVSLLAPGLQASLVDERGHRAVEVPATWIGHGDDGSEARLSIRGHDASGYVRTPAGTFVFEPTSGGAHRVRRAEDVVADSAPVACGLEDHSGDVQAPAAALAAATSIEGEAAHDTMRVLDVSVLADAEYYRRHGSDSVRDLVALFNMVDGVYRSQLGVTLQIVQFVVYRTDSAQPFSTTTSAGQYLSELALARRNDPLLTVGAGGVTHLLTGRTFDERVAGMAWLQGVCDAFSGSSFTSDTAAGSDYLAGIVVAHEMGHNLGAQHDRISGGGCEDAPAGLIMSPFLRNDLVDEFSLCSQAMIDDWTSSASCIAGLVPTGCGDGIVDAGEQCDDGGNGTVGCCRADCTLRAAGLPCGESGDECLDAVCDWTGQCVTIPNDSSCAGDDPCVESRCSAGSCVATDVGREFGDASATFRVSPEGMIYSAKLSASAPLGALGSNPADGGVTLRAAMGSQAAWDEFVPGDRWVRRGDDKFRYRATTTGPGRVTSAKIRLSHTTGLATFRIKLGRPMAFMPPDLPTIHVMSGDPTDGQCATSLLSSCTRSGGNYRCE